MDGNLVISAITVVAGPFADNITDVITGPLAYEKLLVRRAYLEMIRCEVPPDDLEAVHLALRALEAVPDRWLNYSATRRFVRNQVAKSQALSVMEDKETMQRYASICMRMNPAPD
jgi:hypothetical protein